LSLCFLLAGAGRRVEERATDDEYFVAEDFFLEELFGELPSKTRCSVCGVLAFDRCCLMRSPLERFGAASLA
jgi:hypothetical protein